MGAFNYLVTFHHICHRLSIALPILPLLIGLNFLVKGWSPDIVHFLYLIFDGLHNMVNDFRHATYKNLVALPTWRNLQPGDIVATDKYFNRSHATWCFLLGIAKFSISVYVLWGSSDELTLMLFWSGLVLAVLVILSEIIRLITILGGWESDWLTIDSGPQYRPHPQRVSPGCGMAEHLFEVVSNDM